VSENGSATTPPDPWTGGPIGAAIECVLAANPGPMTLDGTNTWLLSAPGAIRGVVIDPGPDDEEHLQAVLAAARARGVTVATTLLSHGHSDHSAGARRFAELTGAPVRALDPAHRFGREGLAGGDVVEVDGLRFEVLGTPGHTADSLCFLLPDLSVLLTGDTVLGRGTAVVAHPDGRLGPYLSSLTELRDLAGEAGLDWLLPGHGPALRRPAEVLQGYLAHREARLDQVRAAVADGAGTAKDVVARVYADVDPILWPAAELSVEAQLEYLRAGTT
jgi:glyoxylase-like metal-dependent hydrolase (beta-lactamase superfamily II)